MNEPRREIRPDMETASRRSRAARGSARLLLSVLGAACLVVGCGPTREPSAMYAGEPWAALREMGDDLRAVADVGKSARAAGSDRENADGGRYLAEIAMQQIQRSVFAPRDFPVFRSTYPESGHTGLVNPDNLYESAMIRPGVDYLVRGTRGSTADVVFQVYEGQPGVGGSLRGISTLSVDQVDFAPDGTFEIHVGPTRHARNWLATDEGAGLMLIRWSHSDWGTERAGRAEIVRVGREGERSADPDVADVARKIRDAGAAVPDAGEFWLDFVAKIRLFTTDNDVMKPRETGGEGLEGQVSAMGKFALEDDEVLIVSVPKTDARYQGVQLGNYWFDSLEWANRQTSLSGGQAHLGSDGRYHYVISKKDPGVPNWLDTTGLPVGLFFLRFQGLQTSIPEPDVPTATLAKLEAVRTHLPADTPTVAPAARRQQLAKRQLHLQRRYGR